MIFNFTAHVGQKEITNEYPFNLILYTKDRKNSKGYFSVIEKKISNLLDRSNVQQRQFDNGQTTNRFS